jgi:hypothetical protein
MPVTSEGKGRARSKTRAKLTMKPRKTVKSRNVAAAALADPRYRKRVVKSAKVYSRKGMTRPEEDEDGKE